MNVQITDEVVGCGLPLAKVHRGISISGLMRYLRNSLWRRLGLTSDQETSSFRQCLSQLDIVPTPAKSGVLRVHYGAVDPSLITTGQPPEAMKHLREVLEQMGVAITVEHDYKYRCVREKKRGAEDAAFNVVCCTQPHMFVHPALYVHPESCQVATPATPLTESTLNFSSERSMSTVQAAESERNYGPALIRQQPSAHATPLTEGLRCISSSEQSLEVAHAAEGEPIYGDCMEDSWGEVRFTVELARVDRLNDMYSLEIRRLKGNLRSYTYMYDTIRHRADLQRWSAL